MFLAGEHPLNHVSCTFWEAGYLDEQLSLGVGNEAHQGQVLKQGWVTSELSR